jgi:hypothetical protein
VFESRTEPGYHGERRAAGAEDVEPGRGGTEWRSAMPYKPKDPLTDPTPDKLRRLNREQDISGDAMRPWIVGGVAVIVVTMLVYGYTGPISKTASAPPSPRSSTTTGAAPTTQAPENR